MDTEQNPDLIDMNSLPGANRVAQSWHNLRRMALGLGVAVVVLVGGGTTALALGSEEEPSSATSSSSMMDGMRQMHESPAAGEMHEQLRADLRVQMDQMHSQMLEMMESSPGS